MVERVQLSFPIDAVGGEVSSVFVCALSVLFRNLPVHRKQSACVCYRWSLLRQPVHLLFRQRGKKIHPQDSLLFLYLDTNDVTQNLWRVGQLTDAKLDVYGRATYGIPNEGNILYFINTALIDFIIQFCFVFLTHPISTFGGFCWSLIIFIVVVVGVHG